MNEVTDQYGRLVNGLGLQPAKDELFIGKWVLKRIPHKSKQLYAIVPALLAILAVVAGEVLYVTWLVYREMHVIWLGLSLKLLTRLWVESDGFFLIMKLLAAGAGVFMAVTIARPAKPKMKL